MPRNTVDDDQFYDEQTPEQIIADDLASQMEHLEVQGGDERPLSPTPSSQMSVRFANEFVDSEDTCDAKRDLYQHDHEQPFYEHHRKHQYHQGFRPESYIPSHHKLTKQHTGLKNISNGVDGAVRPNRKMDFDQEKNEGYGVVKINRPIGMSTKRNTKEDLLANDMESNHSGSDYAATHTAEGYLDLKFYHNPLW